MEKENPPVFYPTEQLKKTAEHKPITELISDDGQDFNSAWDVVAKIIWPATKENQTDREALANELMWVILDDVIMSTAPNMCVIMSRMTQKLMGDNWMEDWLLRNQDKLRARISINQREYGRFSNIWKRFFTKRI